MVSSMKLSRYYRSSRHAKWIYHSTIDSKTLAGLHNLFSDRKGLESVTFEYPGMDIKYTKEKEIAGVVR
jgi:hypothetical protein